MRKLQTRFIADISKYTENFFLGMSARQTVFGIVGVVIVAAGSFILPIPTYVSVLLGLPLLLVGFYKPDGLPLEKYASFWLESKLMRPQIRYYQGDSTVYDYLWRGRINGRQVFDPKEYAQETPPQKEKTKKRQSKKTNPGSEPDETVSSEHTAEQTTTATGQERNKRKRLKKRRGDKNSTPDTPTEAAATADTPDETKQPDDLTQTAPVSAEGESDENMNIKGLFQSRGSRRKAHKGPEPKRAGDVDPMLLASMGQQNESFGEPAAALNAPSDPESLSSDISLQTDSEPHTLSFGTSGRRQIITETPAADSVPQDMPVPEPAPVPAPPAAEVQPAPMPDPSAVSEAPMPAPMPMPMPAPMPAPDELKPAPMPDPNSGTPAFTELSTAGLDALLGKEPEDTASAAETAEAPAAESAAVTEAAEEPAAEKEPDEAAQQEQAADAPAARAVPKAGPALTPDRIPVRLPAAERTDPSVFRLPSGSQPRRVHIPNRKTSSTKIVHLPNLNEFAAAQTHLPDGSDYESRTRLPAKEAVV